MTARREISKFSNTFRKAVGKQSQTKLQEDQLLDEKDQQSREVTLSSWEEQLQLALLPILVVRGVNMILKVVEVLSNAFCT